MRRDSRLQSAKTWIPTYTGKNIVNGYRKWFGVDLQCAIYELKMLNVKIDEQYVNNALKGQAGEILARKKRREEKISGELYPSIFSEDSDETFSFIAGYTSGGCPYGITWEETENFEHDAACENDHLFRKSE